MGEASQPVLHALGSPQDTFPERPNHGKDEEAEVLPELYERFLMLLCSTPAGAEVLEQGWPSGKDGQQFSRM